MASGIYSKDIPSTSKIDGVLHTLLFSRPNRLKRMTMLDSLLDELIESHNNICKTFLKTSALTWDHKTQRRGKTPAPLSLGCYVDLGNLNYSSHILKMAHFMLSPES